MSRVGTPALLPIPFRAPRSVRIRLEKLCASPAWVGMSSRVSPFSDVSPGTLPNGVIHPRCAKVVRVFCSVHGVWSAYYNIQGLFPVCSGCLFIDMLFLFRFVLNNWYDMQHFLVLLKALTFLPAVTQEYIDERRLDGKNFCILEMHMYL